MKIAILCLYYNRPLLIRNALESVLKSHEHHQDWRLLIGDDGSKIPAEPIAREILHEHINKIDFINSKMAIDEKMVKGITIGKFANEYLMSINADVVITLCDDDMLVATYTKKISDFFEHNPECMYCYSNICLYNPLINVEFNVEEEPIKSECSYNQDFDGSPAGKLDASQIAFRLDCVKSHGLRFPETTNFLQMPYVANVDAGFYQQLYDRFGSPWKTEFVSQYKGIHDYQLVWHKKQGVSGLRNYIEKVEELSGKVF